MEGHGGGGGGGGGRGAWEGPWEAYYLPAKQANSFINLGGGILSERYSI